MTIHAIHAIHHAQLAFPPDRRDFVRHFYAGLIGLPEIEGSANGPLRFAAGSQRLDLLAVTDWQAPSPFAHLAFEVQDLPALRQRLRDAGHELDEVRPLPGHRRFYVNDPAGNPLEFLEPIPSPGSAA